MCKKEIVMICDIESRRQKSSLYDNRVQASFGVHSLISHPSNHIDCQYYASVGGYAVI